MGARLITLMAGALAALGLAADKRSSDQPSAKELSKRYRALKPKCTALLDVFKKHTYTHTDGKKMPFRLFEPKAAKGKKYPLVIFLHGLGGKGADNVRQMKDQIVCPAVWALPDNQAKNPCYVLAPQSSGYGTFWCWSAKVAPMAKALFDKVVGEHPIDTDRIYLTGLSMGGYGTWSLIGMYPKYFAAAVPVCGKGDTSKAGAIVKAGVPVWAFHGARDRTVKPAGSRNMIQALKAAGGSPLYTEYPDVGHNSWQGAYTDPKLLPWVFSQKKRAK